MFITRRLHYFSHELNREVVGLYWNTGIFSLAINLAYIFEPIFLYNLKFTLVEIMFFYLILYASYAILLFFCTKITSKIGYKHAMFISSIFYVIYWVVLIQIKSFPVLFFIAPIFFALQKSFFWPAYNADIAISNVREQRGREVGVLFSLVELAAIAGPVLGGLISYKFGFGVLFSLAAFLMLVSVFPLFLTPEVYTRHEFRFKNFWQVARQYPRNFFAYWGYAEDLMLMSLWPIYMFLVIPQVFNIGLIATVANSIAVVLMLYLGVAVDKFKKLPLLQISTVFYAMTWIFRFFTPTVWRVIGFDVATRLGKGMVAVPLLANTYELAGARGPDYAIAYSVFYEFSLAIGKVLTALLAIWILSTTGSIALVFIPVGILTLFYGFLRK